MSDLTSIVNPNLPGVYYSFPSGGKSVRVNQDLETGTDSILILGTALDGIVGEPVAVDNLTAEKAFGAYIDENGISNGANLVPAFKKAWATGCRDIRLMRITGSPASTNIYSSELAGTESDTVSQVLGLYSGLAEDISVDFPAGELYDAVTGNPKLIIGGVIASGIGIYLLSADRITIKKKTIAGGQSIVFRYPTMKTKIESESVLLEQDGASGDFYVRLAAKPELYGSTIADFSVTHVDGATSTPIPAFTAKTMTDGTDTFDVLVIDFSSVSVVPASGDSIEVQYATRDNLAAPGEKDITIDLPANPLTATLENPLVAFDNTNLFVFSTALTGTRTQIPLEDSTGPVIEYDPATGNITIVKERYMAVGGTISVNYNTIGGNANKQAIFAQSFYGGTVYNEGFVEVSKSLDADGEVIKHGLRLKVPAAKKAQSFIGDLLIDLLVCKTFQNVVDELNSNPYNTCYTFATQFPNTLTSTLEDGVYQFSGGDDGLNCTKDEIYDALSGTRAPDGTPITLGVYQKIEHYQCDYVYVAGVYADDTFVDPNKSFVQELAKYCAYTSYRNKIVLGVMETKPCYDVSLVGIQKYVKKLASMNNVYVMRNVDGTPFKDDEGNPLDIGDLITTAGGPEVWFNSPEWSGWVEPGIIYCAQNTALLPQESPMNKTVMNASRVRFTLSNSQMTELNNNSITIYKSEPVTIGSRVNRVTCVDSFTCALENSPYRRHTTVKIKRCVADNTTDVSKPFIGKPATVEQQNALTAALAKRYSILQERGVITGYDFAVVMTADMFTMGKARVDMAMSVPYEFRIINAVIGVSNGVS